MSIKFLLETSFEWFIGEVSWKLFQNQINSNYCFLPAASFIEVRNPSICISLGDKAASEEL